ncbi:hypothetical protein EVA_20578, partial [gut metagenome]
MKQKIINEVIQNMMPFLNNVQNGKAKRNHWNTPSINARLLQSNTMRTS